MRRFYCPTASTDNPITLGKDETRHVRDVLRLNVGDEVSVFNGHGEEFRSSIVSVNKVAAVLNMVEKIDAASPESKLQISVAATVIPGDKYDLIVQKSVELGVVELIPLISKRCEVNAKDAAKRLARWRRIALEATKQCGRAALMKVSEPVLFEDLMNSSTGASMIMFSERDGSKLAESLASSELKIIFGPKGGWDDAELDLARKKGMQMVTFGGRILRAETAAIAITAILQHRFGDMN